MLRASCSKILSCKATYDFSPRGIFYFFIFFRNFSFFKKWVKVWLFINQKLISRFAWNFDIIFSKHHSINYINGVLPKNVCNCMILMIFQKKSKIKKVSIFANFWKTKFISSLWHFYLTSYVFMYILTFLKIFLWFFIRCWILIHYFIIYNWIYSFRF